MNGLTIRQGPCALDFLALGALVNRLDPGIIPWRKATHCDIHVSGGEFNVAANLSDCFKLQTGVASAMVDYPLGDLIAERVRAMGVKPFYKHFQHDGVNGPNMATVYSDRGQGVRAPVVLQPVERGGGALETWGFRLEVYFFQRCTVVPQRRDFCRAVAHHSRSDHRRDAGRQGCWSHRFL